MLHIKRDRAPIGPWLDALGARAPKTLLWLRWQTSSRGDPSYALAAAEAKSVERRTIHSFQRQTDRQRREGTFCEASRDVPRRGILPRERAAAGISFVCRQKIKIQIVAMIGCVEVRTMATQIARSRTTINAQNCRYSATTARTDTRVELHGGKTCGSIFREGLADEKAKMTVSRSSQPYCKTAPQRGWHTEFSTRSLGRMETFSGISQKPVWTNVLRVGGVR